MGDGSGLAALLADVRGCRRCAIHLPLGPRPVLQVDARARLLIASQAPGRRVHASGIPFHDASGTRLRAWMGVESDAFYDPTLIAILPMAFCYPGRGTSGDLPPRPECAPAWRAALLSQLPRIELTLVVGRYAINAHLAARAKPTLTQTVAAWRDHWPGVVPLPHPSPRNNHWLRASPWFERDLVPSLRRRIADVLAGCATTAAGPRRGPALSAAPRSVNPTTRRAHRA